MKLLYNINKLYLNYTKMIETCKTLALVPLHIICINCLMFFFKCIFLAVPYAFTIFRETNNNMQYH